MAEVKARLRVRQGASSIWASINPTLLAGEIAYETDTKRMRIGDGSTAYNGLQYVDFSAAPQVQGANLDALRVLTGAADRLPYFSGTTTMALTTLTAFARSILDDTSADDVLATLGILNAAVPAGAIQAFARASAPAGWLKCNGSTIGSASSGALYANALAQPLFNLLWADFSDTNLPILTSAGAASTRGASAAADWAASKRLTLPDLRGEFVRGLDEGRGVDAGRALGSAQGDANKSHSHSVTDPGHTHTSGFVLGSGNPRMGTSDAGGPFPMATTTGSSQTGITIAMSGGAEARPRNVALLYCIKI